METRLENLTTAVNQLTAEADELRAELARTNAALHRRTRTVAGLALLGLVLGAVFLAATVRVVLDNRAAIDESNARWCPLITLLVPHQGEAVTTERGQRIANEAVRLADDFRCPTT